METTYFVLDSSVSEFYPYNKPSNFTVWLGRPENFRGAWRIGLSEFIIDGAPASAGDIFVTCSVAVQSFTLKNYQRNLRRIALRSGNSSHTFSPVQYYILDNVREFDKINITLVDADTLREVNLSKAKVTCILHVTR